MAILELARDVVDFCYPGICAACRASADPRKTLCSSCLSALAALEAAAACAQCAMPISEEGAPCPFCQGKGIPHYDTVFRLGVFEDPLKQLIHLLKYGRRWAAGEFLAQRLLEHARVRALIGAVDVLVPVPLHPFRHFTRGYNQAAVVARVIGRRLGKPIVRPLSRIRHTESQTNLRSRQKRIDNLHGAFHLRLPKGIEGKRVLVVDDVMTTGATLQAIARALKPAHPESLDALLLAVADPKGRSFEVI